METLEDILNILENEYISHVYFYKERVVIHYLNGGMVSFFTGNNKYVVQDIYNKCKELNIKISFKKTYSVFSIIYNFLIFIAIVTFIIGNSFFLFFNPFKPVSNTEFNTKQVEIKEEIKVFLEKQLEEEIDGLLDMMRNPEKYNRLNASIPRGVLLYGPPGTGKTLIARYIAQKGGMNFIYISGADFDNKYVGVGADKVRSIFNKAKSIGKTIIFIDEFDAVAGKRSTDDSWRNQTINEFLNQLGGFEPNDNVFVLASTNNIDILDPAVLRSGRFDMKLKINYPNTKLKREMFEYYLSKYSVEDDMDYTFLATFVETGADINNVINQAAILAAREDSYINYSHLTEAFEKIFFGTKLDSDSIDPKSYEKTVYHELGHAYMAYLYGYDIYKISAVPRGEALGWVSYKKSKNDYEVMDNKSSYLKDISIALAGQIMEELIYGKDFIGPGAYDDLRKARNIASHMVRLFGMGNSKVVYHNDSATLLSLSEVSKADLDSQVAQIIDQEYKNTYAILKNQLHILKKVYKILIENKELLGSEFIEILENL